MKDGMTELQTERPPFSGLRDVWVTLIDHWKILTIGPLVVGLIAFAATYAIQPKYTARATIFPPQPQQQSAATAIAMQSLGAIAGLASTAPGVRNPSDQYISLMQSVTVSNRVIEAFKLAKIYGTRSPGEARDVLASNVNLIASRKDGLIHIDVEDVEPQRAAAIANGYIDQLRRLTADFALTEAQQRRIFFERQLLKASEKLADAQRGLQESGITEGVLRVDPKTAAASYASLKSQITAMEMKLYTMGGYLTSSAPEYKIVLANLRAMKAQLAKVEKTVPELSQGEYIEKYREYRYQETLFEMFAKQFELAKLDESREGALIQVVDRATPPERKSKPRRLPIALTAAAIAGIVLLIYIMVRGIWRRPD